MSDPQSMSPVICTACGREESLWGNCFRPRGECRQRIDEQPIGQKPVARLPTRIITVTEPGYDVALFFNEDGGAEAVISRPDDQQPTGVNIAPPTPGRRIVVERSGNKFEVVYRDI